MSSPSGSWTKASPRSVMAQIDVAWGDPCKLRWSEQATVREAIWTTIIGLVIDLYKITNTCKTGLEWILNTRIPEERRKLQRYKWNGNRNEFMGFLSWQRLHQVPNLRLENKSLLLLHWSRPRRNTFTNRRVPVNEEKYSPSVNPSLVKKGNTVHNIRWTKLLSPANYCG